MARLQYVERNWLTIASRFLIQEWELLFINLFSSFFFPELYFLIFLVYTYSISSLYIINIIDDV